MQTKRYLNSPLNSHTDVRGKSVSLHLNGQYAILNTQLLIKTVKDTDSLEYLYQLADISQFIRQVI